MIKTIKLFGLSVIGLVLFSCDNITEEIYLNEDGTGEYIVYSDMIPAIRNMAIRMSTMFADDSASINQDSLMMAVEESIWEDFPEEVDSVFDYSSTVPDSIKSDPKHLKILEKTQGFMKGGKSKGYVNTGARLTFDDLSELEDFFDLMQESQNKSQDEGDPFSGKYTQSKVAYQLANNVFSRKTTIIKKPDLTKVEVAMMVMFMPEGKFRTIVHLPKNAKSVTGDHLAEIKGNQAIFEYGVSETMTAEVNTDFEIIFEE